MHSTEAQLSIKYRPTAFATTVGQEQAKSLLSAVAKADGVTARSLLLQGSYGSGKCVDPETVIRTSGGLRVAKDILHDTYLPKFDILGQRNSFVGKELNRNSEIFDVSTSLGCGFSVTRNHPVLVYKDDEYRFELAESLRFGDVVFLDMTKNRYDLINNDLVEILALLTHCSTNGSLFISDEALVTSRKSVKTLLQSFDVKRSKGGYFVRGFDLEDSFFKACSDEHVRFSEYSLRSAFVDLESGRVPTCIWSSSWSYSAQLLFARTLLRFSTVRPLGWSLSLPCSPDVYKTLSLIMQPAGFVSYYQGGALHLVNISARHVLCSTFGIDRSTQPDYPNIDGVLFPDFPHFRGVQSFYYHPVIIESIETRVVEYTIDFQCETLPVFFTNGFITHNTTLARIFGKAANCKDFKKTGDVCNECQHCKEVDSGVSTLYREFDATRVGTVEGVKQLTSSLILSAPPQGVRRTVVLDEVHACSTASQTSLLKVLEEGVPNTFFMFCTTHNVLPTIVSRSTLVPFSTIPHDLLFGLVKSLAYQEGRDLSDDVGHLIVAKSQGHARNAVSILDSYLRIGSDAVASSYYDFSQLVSLAMSKGDDSAIKFHLNKVLSYSLVDINFVVSEFLRRCYLRQGDLESKVGTSGVVSKFMSYFYQSWAVEARKDERGVELLLLDFVSLFR